MTKVLFITKDYKYFSEEVPEGYPWTWNLPSKRGLDNLLTNEDNPFENLRTFYRVYIMIGERKNLVYVEGHNIDIDVALNNLLINLYSSFVNGLSNGQEVTITEAIH